MTISKSYTPTPPRLLLVGIHAPYNRTANIDAYYDEFMALARSNGIEAVESVFFKLRAIDPGTFITKGHLATLADICREKNIDELLISEPLTPQQERNLGDFLNVRVFDRTQLILEIFEKAAMTAEGKMQVALAMLEHEKTRLAGKGKGMAQQRGILGLRAGFGETLKERERRNLEHRMLFIKKELKQLEQTRHTQRKQRLKNKVPLVCLVGYTNAGKSTILNMLTKSNVLAVDKLFATLDTTTRELYLKNKHKILISDTVGFIQLLPPQLIEAFKSTLAELTYANFLLHVVDLSNPEWELHIHVVQHILKDLSVDTEMLYVFNKIDAVTLTPELQKRIDLYQPQVMVSAKTKKGVEPLIGYLESVMCNKDRIDI